MRSKKHSEADIDKKKSSMFLMGLVFVGAGTLCAFEYTIWDESESGVFQVQMDALEDETVDEAPPEILPPPPPPPPQPTVIEIVDDEEEIEEELDVQDLEVEEETEIEIIEEVEEVVEEEQIFTIVEDAPEFPGGEEAMYKYLSRSIKYPAMAKDAGISGVVYLNFIVDKKGKISDVKVLRGIGGGCDEEAMRVVKAMPDWAPGKQRGKAVKVSFNMPIRFTLK